MQHIWESIRVLRGWPHLTVRFFILLIILFATGPIVDICKALPIGLGEWLNNFWVWGLDPGDVGGEALTVWWTLFDWTVWIAYAPVMGLFLAKISYERTIREFMIINWILPSVFGFVWFSVWGGTALNWQMKGVVDLVTILKENDATANPEYHGHFNVLRGYIEPKHVAGVKVVGDYVFNYKKGLPSEMSLLNLFDPETGAPYATIDATAITSMRTGAMTAVGAKKLANKKNRSLGHLGCRGTAFWNVVLLDHLYDFEEIRINSRRRESMEEFAKSLEARLHKKITITNNRGVSGGGRYYGGGYQTNGAGTVTQDRVGSPRKFRSALWNNMRQ